MSLDIGLFVEIDTGSVEGVQDHFVWEYNITHNLRPMAEACGLGLPLWNPNFLDGAFNYKECFASDLIEPIKEGLKELKSNPIKYKQFNAPNGWGKYENLVNFASEFLKACKTHPKTKVWISK
ncbi:conserved hypothetical protein [Vibrio phage 249E41-1]|nr:conserved hypothetical protein [Vibrio phage 249E41-1]